MHHLHIRNQAHNIVMLASSKIIYYLRGNKVFVAIPINFIPEKSISLFVQVAATLAVELPSSSSNIIRKEN